MCIFDHEEFDDHEAVHFLHDPSSGLRAIIAIHDSTLGPAMGGCRMHDYADSREALTDVLRLSRGMTMKAAMAGLPFGGGKSVIIGDPGTVKTPALLRAFGRAVEGLGGRYYTGEDVGITPADMAVAGQQTRYVLGREAEGCSGDPSPFTAEGVRLAIETALVAATGDVAIQGCKVAIQGLGAVGMALARNLKERGADLVVADIDPTRTARARDKLGAEIATKENILAQPCDVLAPCAMGAVLNEVSLPGLACRVIAGSANNQLADDSIGDRLHEMGILYAPDYVANAGGLINITQELSPGGYDAARSRKALEVIPLRLAQVFGEASRAQLAPHRVADGMARTIINDARKAALKPSLVSRAAPEAA